MESPLSLSLSLSLSLGFRPMVRLPVNEATKRLTRETKYRETKCLLYSMHAFYL